MTHDPLETSEPLPLSALKTALSGFVTDIAGFHTDLNSKLHKHEERLNMIDRKSMTLSRPALATTAEPWPGPVALYSSRYDADFALNTVLQSPAVLGVTATPLAAATPGILDHGTPLEVELTRGSLSGVTLEALLSGANLAAIGDGSSDNWEIFQFQSADLMASGRYELSGRLRGQLGSDALMPAHWPAGSYFVLLDGAPQQIELAASGRNILQYFQIGPAARPYSDYSYRKLSAAFAGNGLRPYAPVHLDQKWDGTDVEFSWIRRARLDGASWDLAEIPLLETTERYQVKIFSGAQLLRQEEVSQAQWRYSAAMRSADGAHGLLELQVAQLSESFGPGLFRKFRFTA